METRVIVADASRARILVSHTTLKKLQEVEGFAHPQARLANRDLVSDGPGRARGAGDDYTPPTSPKEHEAEVFARMLAKHLKDLHNREHYEELILVAPPGFLGLLRQKLPAPLDKLLSRSVDKDLTTCSVEEIIEQIRS